MQFLIQVNLMNEDSLALLKDAVQEYPHQFVCVIPFSDDISSDSPLDGVDYIPYGSTRLSSIAKDRGYTGMHFDIAKFTYSEAIKHRDDMLNGEFIGNVASAIKYLETLGDQDVFIRPDKDLKQFSGQIINTKECIEWLKSAIDCSNSSSWSLTGDDIVVIAVPKPILAEFRWFVVGGKVVSGSLYRLNGQLIKSRCILEEEITEAQKFADKWLPDSCCVMDIALLEGDIIKVIEFNTINSSGFYDHDVKAIIDALWKFHANDD